MTPSSNPFRKIGEVEESKFLKPKQRRVSRGLVRRTGLRAACTHKFTQSGWACVWCGIPG